ncbi:hypothetical protein [Nocardia asteroides]|uniref:hypothetical protein n=1 Tax=Nocardia asteroides TaxID=1824 RepID=UPI001E4A00DF|nr:hypothetical protein [Nocardia asteroides]UGT60879.1 hypothetical protein LTT61_27630 [Nocardia asteroides]
MEVDRILEYRTQSFINFRDFDFDDRGKHRFRWIDIKKFAFELTEWDDRLILQALIANPEFPDDYVGGGVDREGLRHGPYWRASITPEAYRKIDTVSALDIFGGWLSGCGVIPAELDSAIAREVRDPMRTADSRYLLRELGSSASNDYGDIHIEFHEFVLISEVEKSVLLVVATDD